MVLTKQESLGMPRLSQRTIVLTPRIKVLIRSLHQSLKQHREPLGLQILILRLGNQPFATETPMLNIPAANARSDISPNHALMVLLFPGSIVSLKTDAQII